MDDNAHTEAIRTAMLAAFNDSNCTLTYLNVQKMAEQAWQDVIEENTRRHWMGQRNS